MAAKRDKVPSAPRPTCACCGDELFGMDRRELCGRCLDSRVDFATAASQALTSLYDEPITPQLAGMIADEAFAVADAMLRRAKGPYAYAGEP